MTVDARGLNCPLPVLKARKAMQAVGSGETVEVLATDPSAPKDFGNFCEAQGHHLVDSRAEAGVYTFLIRKK